MQIGDLVAFTNTAGSTLKGRIVGVASPGDLRLSPVYRVEHRGVTQTTEILVVESQLKPYRRLTDEEHHAELERGWTVGLALAKEAVAALMPRKPREPVEQDDCTDDIIACEGRVRITQETYEIPDGDGIVERLGWTVQRYDPRPVVEGEPPDFNVISLGGSPFLTIEAAVMEFVEAIFAFEANEYWSKRLSHHQHRNLS